MRWIYRLQQRVAITRNECFVMLGLAFLFGLGLVARHLQQHAHPLSEVDYTEAEARFQQASEAPAAADQPALPAPDAQAAPTTAPPAYPSKPALPATPLNLNTATAAELQRLPRIGPKLAARIVAYREAHGRFRRVQELTAIRGIGTKTLARLEPYLVVEAPEE